MIGPWQVMPTALENHIEKETNKETITSRYGAVGTYVTRFFMRVKKKTDILDIRHH